MSFSKGEGPIVIYLVTKDYENIVRWVQTAFGINGYGSKSTLNLEIPSER